MTIYLNFAELNSLASLGAIAPRPGSSDAAVLEHVRIEVVDRTVTAYATDRYIAARIRFDLLREPDDAHVFDHFTVSADTLRRAALAAKRAPGTGWIRVDVLTAYPLEGVVDMNVGDGADNFRSFPARLPGADRISTFPPIGRLFPESDEHVNDIVAGEPVSALAFAAAAKLRHPEDVLTGRGKTEFGNVRVSLARAGMESGKSAWLISRRAGNVALLIQPLNPKAASAAIDEGKL